MIAAPPAIHYHVTVTCDDAPCTVPIEGKVFGGGFPTPVPPQFIRIGLQIDPQPPVLPETTWTSEDATIAYPSATSPFEHMMMMPGDTAATPPPNGLRTLLIPVRQAAGLTWIDATVGAPVNERVRIPVYTIAVPTPFQQRAFTVEVSAISGASAISMPHASIAYDDPVTSTYGATDAIFTEDAWPPSGGFFQAFGSVRVAYSPQPYQTPAVTWGIEGDAATLQQHGAAAVLHGVHAGRSTLHAHLGTPFDEDLALPLTTYPTLVLPCGSGIRFTPSGDAVASSAFEQSDLYLDCKSLRVPGGGVLLTNGNDPTRDVPPNVLRGPQFPDLDASLWRSQFTVLDPSSYDVSIEPCTKAVSPGLTRIDWTCRAMTGQTLLLRTRDGRYVKWLMQIGNGFSILAGPYQVL